ncbi:MAG: NAD(P) transhydrogenase [Cellvibrionaceae bacterium]|jgi:NAD(P) transhydrogenase
MKRQISRNNIDRIHGLAAFKDEHRVKVTTVQCEATILHSEKIIIAKGSYPRAPDNIEIDHEHIYDSGSILSILYLPKSLVVLGGGVIASEYASMFQAIDVEVTMIDKYPQPLGFLDNDLTEKFVHAFETMGGKWMGNTVVKKA